MANLEHDFFFIVKIAPYVFCNKRKSLKIDDISVWILGIVSFGYIDDVAVDVFFDHKPGASAQSESFALSDGMEPIPLMFAENISRFQFNNQSFFFPQITFNKFVVI